MQKFVQVILKNKLIIIGLGGGFKENENVDYIRRNDSNEEFDEYGRRRGKINPTNHSIINKSDSEDDNSKSNDSNESESESGKETDEDKSSDNSNDSYQDEDYEEDSDDDVDLSKYDFGDDDISNTKRKRSLDDKNNDSMKKKSKF